MTILSEKGVPTPVVHTRLRAPRSSMTESASIAQVAKASPLFTKYGTRLERESAAEELAKRVEAAPPADDTAEAPQAAQGGEAGRKRIDRLSRLAAGQSAAERSRSRRVQLAAQEALARRAARGRSPRSSPWRGAAARAEPSPSRAGTAARVEGEHGDRHPAVARRCRRRRRSWVRRPPRRAPRFADESDVYALLVAYTDLGGCHRMVVAAGTSTPATERVDRLLASACGHAERASTFFTRAVRTESGDASARGAREARRSLPGLVRAAAALDTVG